MIYCHKISFNLYSIKKNQRAIPIKIAYKNRMKSIYVHEKVISSTEVIVTFTRSKMNYKLLALFVAVVFMATEMAETTKVQEDEPHEVIEEDIEAKGTISISSQSLDSVQTFGFFVIFSDFS